MIDIVDMLELFVKINEIIVNGASFCHVAKISLGIHLDDIITDGNHQWQGNLPIFIIMAIINKKYIILVFNNIVEYLKSNNIEDPKACAKKYLIDPSVSWFVFVANKIGINLNKFNSIANQIHSQFDLDIAMITLIIIIK